MANMDPRTGDASMKSLENAALRAVNAKLASNEAQQQLNARDQEVALLRKQLDEAERKRKIDEKNVAAKKQKQDESETALRKQMADMADFSIYTAPKKKKQPPWVKGNRPSIDYGMFGKQMDQQG